MKLIWYRIKYIYKHTYRQKQKLFLGIFLFIFSNLFSIEGKVNLFKDPIPETRAERLKIAQKALECIHEAAHNGLFSPYGL